MWRHIYIISAWALTLSVLQYRAMRRPQRVGQTASGSHAFFMSKRQGHKIITMRKKIIFPVAVLIFILAMFLFSVIGGGSKIAIECKPVADKSKVPSNIHLDVYVENSGSMDGYMCPGSNLKDAVYDYISDLSKVTSSNSFYYINSQMIKCNESLSSYIQNLTPVSFARAGGNRANTDLRQMINTILHNHKKNGVSVFISDCILDIPENAMDFFGNCQVSIKNSFIEAIKKNSNLGVEIIKLQSKFDGYWYCGTSSEKLVGVKRPYYIWVIGDKCILAKLNKEAPVRDILGGIEQYCAFSTSGEIPFDIDKTRYVVNHSGLVNVQVLANLSYALQDESVVSNPNSYGSTNPSCVKVVKVEKITAKGSKYSHVIDMELVNPKSIKSETISFSLPGVPSWVRASNDDSGTNVKKNLNKTTGILYLVNGVADAYKGYTTYGNIMFDVKNK